MIGKTAQPTHPELLDWLARELVTHDYDRKHIARLIFNSQAYQRVATSDEAVAKTLAAPLRRRMTAEQVLDSRAGRQRQGDARRGDERRCGRQPAG